MRLEQEIAYKQAQQQQVSKQLDEDMDRFKEMEREAAALISKARHANSKLMVSSCRQPTPAIALCCSSFKLRFRVTDCQK